jgi:hypothetical protein
MLKSLYLLMLCLTLASTGHALPFHLDTFFHKSIATHSSQAKDPSKIAFYHHSSAIKHPYRIIGKSSISRRNIIGISRQPSTLNAMLRKKAADMGGDAIIDFKQDNQKIEATIIAFEKAFS